MSEYTPTTDEVRETYERARYYLDDIPEDGDSYRAGGGEFDRWLAEHDRAVACAIAPHVMETNTQVENVVARMRAFGLTDDEQLVAIEQAARFASYGAIAHYADLVTVFVHIINSGKITAEDVQQMGYRGISIRIRPDAFAARARERRVNDE